MVKAPDFLTFQHYKSGRSSAIRTGRLYTRRNPWFSLSEAESTSGHMVLSGVPRKKSPVTPPGIDPGTSRLVAQCLNHYATPGLYILIFGGLGVACWPLVPKFAGSNPAEAFGFLRAKKSSALLPSEGK